MSTVPDDLETLLMDVRRTISDNSLFLKTLKDDTPEEVEDEADDQEEAVIEDEFEEL